MKNWLAGVSGPSGEHLIDLVRSSDEVLEVLLVLAGREQSIATKKLIDARDKIAETLATIDSLINEIGQSF